MKKLSCLMVLTLLLSSAALQAQNFISMTYQTDSVTVPYGSSVDFAGYTDTHLMDISFPIGDNPPVGGRPLMVLVHGGVFMSGTRKDAQIRQMRRDFAKRGYVTAAIDYRLGMFQTSSQWNCNITGIAGIEWNCMNQADTTEWIRAWYRGIQDTHGAIRYLVNNASTYNINPNKVFVVGQSAGAFIALGTGFLDQNSEIPYGVGAIANAPRPNAIYDYGCVRKYGWAPSLASLNLARPSLGSYLGTMNTPSAPYKIIGVGDFYGAIFGNLFTAYASNTQIPCLYMYHRTNDILVPSGREKALSKYSYCASSGSACSPILNRPYVSGATHMKSIIDQRAAQGLPRPQYQAEIVTVNISCDINSHQIDNFGLRTGNMATFFAPRVLATNKMGEAADYLAANSETIVFPNPSTGTFQVRLAQESKLQAILLTDLTGKEVLRTAAEGNEWTLTVPAEIARGVYLLRLRTIDSEIVRRVVLQ